MSIRIRPWLPLAAFAACAAFGCDNSDVIADHFGAAGAAGSDGAVIDAGNAGEASGGSDAAGRSPIAASGFANAAGNGGSAAVGSSAGGEAGTNTSDAGAGASEIPSPNCDDGNPCTTDSFGVGACHHQRVPDGQRCEDGDFCTLGDQCTSGVCSGGERQIGAARELGSLSTYGASLEVAPGSVGLVVTPGDDRFLFVDQPEFVPQITEARVVDGVLQTLDTLVIPTVDSIDPPIATAWADLAAVAGDSTSVEIGGDPRLIQLVSVSPSGKLSARGAAPMGGDAITSMVGRGPRLLVCTNFSFFTSPVGTLHWLDVANPDVPVEVTSGSLGSQCGSLAISEDGERVYVNTANGVRFSDLSAWSGSGPLTFAPDPLIPTDSGLALRGDKLLARSGSQIHVLDETTHDELSSFAVPGAHAAGFTDAGIFVQGDRAAGTGSEYFIALYTESGELLQERILTRFAYLRDITSAKPAIGATYVSDTLDDQIFALDRTGFQPVSAPSVGSLSHLFASPDGVQARGIYNAQRIDVTDPTRPVISAGGPSGNPVFGFKLDESLSPAALIPELDPGSIHPNYDIVEVKAVFGHASASGVQGIIFDANERPVAAESIELPAGDAQLLSAGNFIYRIATISGSVHLQRWLTRDLRAGILAPALDLDLAVSAAEFGVDPDARMAVLVTSADVRWLDLSVDPPLVTITPVASPPTRRIKLRGHRFVGTVDGSNLGFMAFGSSDVEIVNEVSYHGAYIEDIIGFDGNVAYLSVSVPGVDGVLGGPALQAVKRGVPAEQALVAEIRMPSLPTSLIAMDHSLVIGSAFELVTLAPHCE